MSDREELVKIIERARDNHIAWCTRPGPPENRPHTVLECIADAIIASGWMKVTIQHGDDIDADRS